MTPIELETRYCAKNDKPLAVVLARGDGAHVHDTDGQRHIDMMSAYSATSYGHAHPRILKALARQAARLAVLSKTHSTVVRLAPPLVIAREDLDRALDRFEEVLLEVARPQHGRAAA